MVKWNSSQRTTDQADPAINRNRVYKQKKRLNSAREYFMKSKEDCSKEINSVFKLIASIQ
ncbi:hypothetical protein BpHYR1_030355 [Brachionus plicatilis]|uniref:Uncharacterized protein n=1 Tax=Brachionus plicatilis TaxID=10195 RepID=A0A3M7RC37_BRAPC|nr:hypothetical protein BpHYR1_030355 [Brachionus plicatilis]